MDLAALLDELEARAEARGLRSSSTAGHFELIDPRTPEWAAVVARL